MMSITDKNRKISYTVYKFYSQSETANRFLNQSERA